MKVTLGKGSEVGEILGEEVASKALVPEVLILCQDACSERIKMWKTNLDE